MTIVRMGGSAAWVGALCVLSGCGWEHLDAIGPAAIADAGSRPDAPNDDAAHADEGAAEAFADNDNADISREQAEAASDSAIADVAGPIDASFVDAASSALPCTGSPNVVRQWAFDLDGQAWTLMQNAGVQGKLAWNGGTGDPAPGALEVDITPGPADIGGAKLAWARYAATALGDLSGRTISAWVWVDRGGPPQLKLFVQTGSQYAWADNGTVTPIANTWTCLSFPVSSPAYNGPGYDPTSVVALGVEVRGSTPLRIFIDTVRYY